MLKRRCVSVFCVSIVAGFASSVGASAQDPPAQIEILGATSQIRSGDAAGALFTLNRGAKAAADRPAALARVHAYQVWAYVSLDQPERAQAAAVLALKADSMVAIDPNEFTPQVVAIFDGVRHPARDPEGAGNLAESANRFPQAFLAYLSAYQSLPDPPAPADDRRLREKIINSVQKLPASLIVPPEAVEHLKKANDLLDAEKVLGASVATEQAAATELRQAIRSAPWSSEAAFQLATVLQKLQRVDEALLNLTLYKLADPAGYTATASHASPSRAEAPAARTEPEAKKALPAIIHVYFPHAARAAGVKPQLMCDGQTVAELANGRFITLSATPGFHNFEFKGRTTGGSFDAGTESYIRIGIEGYPAHFALHVTAPDKAAAEMLEKEVAPNDANRTFSSECTSANTAPRKSRS
jgi:tetratricopeptide (TPR) repeat protein